MKAVNFFLCGVGGQGIGLLSEVLIRAAMRAGYPVKGCDTHGLAQRGGVVQSHLRIGEDVHAPLVPEGEADVVLALERLEALRATETMLRDGGTVVFYDTTYQPTVVRMRRARLPEPGALAQAVERRAGRLERVFVPGLADPRQQNVALLGRLVGLGIVLGLDAAAVEATLAEVVPARALDANLAVFRAALAGAG